MALTEEIKYDKIEVVGDYKQAQIRKQTLIKKDGVIIAQSFHRYTLDPGTLDGSDNLVDNPLDKESDGVTAIPDEVKAICAAAWTTVIKDAWKAQLIANKTATS